MSIESDRLAAWTNKGSDRLAINSHHSIRSNISNISKRLGVSINVFLQGSYKNNTNIRGDSDVDVVVQCTDVFFHNLSQDDNRLSGYSDGVIDFNDFDDAAARSLIEAYGRDSVTIKNKSIKVTFKSSSYNDADVVLAFPYRNYTSGSNYIEGIAIRNRSNRNLIVNYPKQHFENGNRKSNSTNGLFKTYVRLVKNARKYLSDKYGEGFLNAPSYFIESLVYNLEDRIIMQHPVKFLSDAIDYWEYTDESNCSCQNGISRMYGYDDTCWTHHYKEQFAAALRNLLR